MLSSGIAMSYGNYFQFYEALFSIVCFSAMSFLHSLSNIYYL